MNSKRRRSTITDNWVAHTKGMRESSAWRCLPDTARRVLDRLELEHMRHGGARNGDLICTYSDFVRSGIRRASISLAIRQTVALGFVEVMDSGGRSISGFRAPSRYRLTYLNGVGRSSIPTDDWKRISSDDVAQAALVKAKEEKRYDTQPLPRTARKPQKAGLDEASEPGTFSGLDRARS